MKNLIVKTAHFGPVYARKIYVYFEGGIALPHGQKWGFAWATNAHRTCRDAIAAAVAKHPDIKFKANFAKGTK
jgi:hypothetical protein